MNQLKRIAGGLALATALAAPVPAAVAKTVPAAPTARSLTSVTLITGDRVSVGDGKGAPVISPGPGRRNLTFSSTRVNGRLTVIPSDVRALVGSGRLDRRLFDVTGLIDSGYDDAHTKVIPILVTQSQAQARSAPTGLSISRRLPVVNATAGTVAKGSNFLTTAGNGFRKIWLDGKRKPLLDHSVPQIGAPAAWQAGYTGKGVRVAVLDSGVDATHPDLASRVKGVKNFADTLPGDQLGHGTHVASIVAGTGAASGGKYRGVAPDADLYDGKVCTDIGCSDSMMLAGLQWAATEVHAQVVNISIGTPDTPEVDPVEEAINTLTAQTGTLFVVSAGNLGEHGTQTLTSPGTAAAALTVGAVDRDDQLADFSSQGPGWGTAELKPDVTAPGVDIVAARSGQSPGDGDYVAKAGTSMAAPHTAGAAALLAQQHPDWHAAELKSALMSSAIPTAGLDLFKQGTGRIDVAHAITQTVTADQSSLSLGNASWPHSDDAPVVKDITYRNSSSAPVTLALTTELTGPTGAPAPAQALTLSTSQVAVAAGGTATVKATSSTNHSGPDGRYVGLIVAKAVDGTAVRIPLTVTKDPEMYDLTVKAIGPDGAPAAEASLSLFSIDRPEADFDYGQDGVFKRRVLRGDYAADTQFLAGDAQYALAQPMIQVTKDTTVVLDARDARKVAVELPRADARTAYQSLDYLRTSADGTRSFAEYLASMGPKTLYTLGQGPSLPADQLKTFVYSQSGVPGPDGDFRDTPYLYNLADRVDGVIPTGYRRTVRDRQLATVATSINRGAGTAVQLTTTGRLDGYEFPLVPIVFTTPATIVEHLEPAPVSWSQTVTETRPTPDGFDQVVSVLAGEPASYRSGSTTQHRWNAVAYGPAQATATRQNGKLTIAMATTSDADGHPGDTLVDTSSSRLLRDGAVIASSDQYGALEADVAPGTVRYETSMTRPSVAPWSDRVDYAATFSSGADGKVNLPTVGYRPAVDSQNLAKRTAVSTLPLVVAAEVKSVQISGDGGATWRAATVVKARGGYQATFPTPAGARTISVRTTVVDTAGTKAEQTTYNAYGYSNGS
ncbi:S8 family serine peptidase [Kribbella sp. NPDC051587]|uniref:S8 family serine peptidase n=1 Tax=Kribbella sp. NPDC051587 TaxID=3364119 RepID=UPI0037B04BFB